MVQLANQVVVITGSSRWFGKAMAIEFQRAGACVVVSSRDADAVKATVSALPQPANALGAACDVRDLNQVGALADVAVARFGQIDIWINNAGISPGWGKTTDIDPARWRESFETNFLRAYHGCRVALEKMLPRKTGQIINVLGAGAEKRAPNQSAYGTSKTAIARLTETLAKEYADSGVSITSIMPGMIWTEMLTGAEGVDEPRMRARFEWAMRVFGNPPEVPARFVVALAQRGGESGRMYKVLSPRMFVPRMIGEVLGAGRRNPRPWEKQRFATETHRITQKENFRVFCVIPWLNPSVMFPP
ncbi:MAG: SDR family oxidoreductase [Chloroflexota bacterium]|nr:SDR family oxidoreductase [Chloroflexota bacterium]